MSNKVVSRILFVLLLGWIAGVSYWFVCKMRNNCESTTDLVDDATDFAEAIEIEKIIANKTFSISDGDLFNLESENNVSFSVGKADLSVPDELTKNFAAIQEYLGNNEGKNLLLTGLYADNEGNSVGEARAQSLSDFFTNNYGIASSRISLASKRVDEFSINEENNRAEGGVEFSFENLVNESAESPIIAEETAPTEIQEEKVIEKVSSSRNVDSRVLRAAKSSKMIYYPPNGFDIEPNITEDLNDYFRNLKKYFDQNPDGVIEISGHSEEGSSPYENKKMSEAKAVAMRSYLMKKYRIKRENLKVRGRGDSELIDYSGTEMAKAKNRRISFKFIK